MTPGPHACSCPRCVAEAARDAARADCARLHSSLGAALVANTKLSWEVESLRAERDRAIQSRSLAQERSSLDAQEKQNLRAALDEVLEALNSLSGALPNVIYIHGAYGDRWSDSEPGDEYEVVELAALVAKHGGA